MGWTAGQTGLERQGEGRGWPPVPGALQDWHRKLCSRFPVWARPGQGPRRGRGEAWTCHQRPLGKVLAHPPQAGCSALLPPHGTRAPSVAGAEVLITKEPCASAQVWAGLPTQPHWRLFPKATKHLPQLASVGGHRGLGAPH